MPLAPYASSHERRENQRLLPVVLPLVFGSARHHLDVLRVTPSDSTCLACEDAVQVLVCVANDETVDANRDVRHDALQVPVSPHGSRGRSALFLLRGFLLCVSTA